MSTITTQTTCTVTTAPLHFFDSHGIMWRTCGPYDDRAQLFGPRAAAYCLTAAEVRAQLGEQNPSDCTAYAMAARLDRVDFDGGWDILTAK